MDPSTKVLLYHGHYCKIQGHLLLKFNVKTLTYLLCSSPGHRQYDLPGRQHRHPRLPLATPHLPGEVKIGTVGSFPTLKQSR
jgi:hypothetical protein